MSKTRFSARPVNHNQAARVAAGLGQRLGRIVFDALIQSADAQSDGPPLVVERAAAPLAPARLADLHGGTNAARAEMRALYENCLRTYRTAIRPQDIAVDDIGAALANFVAASLFALHGIGASREMLERIERQLQGVARLGATVHAATTGERQYYFETLATLGVLVAGRAEHAKSQGAAAVAAVRTAARGYLLDLLGIDPDLLVLDATGLSVCAERHAHSHAVH
jgi:hypothetical protein